MTISSKSITLESLGVPIVGQLFLPGEERKTPVLIICHGAGEFKENYFELCECLARQGVAALALDMHGHGASGGERFHVNIDQWVEDIRAAVRFLSQEPGFDVNRIGAFGLSSGGTAILEAALVEPKLRALVTLDATVRNSMPWSFTVVMRLLVWMGRIKKALTHTDWRLPLIKFMHGIQLASDPEVDRRLRADPRTLAAYLAFPFPGAAQSMFVDTLRRVSRIAVPTLVLWGEDDKLDPPETARRLYEALVCKKQIHIIPGNGHVGHLDRNRDKVFALTADWALENLV